MKFVFTSSDDKWTARVFHVLMLVFAIVVALHGQAQRGKISGYVIDAKTKEPLIGATILIEGTTLGAASDVDGHYVILNVPPGTYSLSASMLSYGKLTQTNVEVFIDRTSEVNFRLQDATIQVQEVVVVAQRPKIVKDQTATSQTMDDAQIRNAPIEGMRGALDLSSSFQKNETGNYRVRGSGQYEVNFQINGVEQTTASTGVPGSFASDKANNSWKYDVNPLGVQQIQLISGGFSAEYGNAQAGVVKVVTKEGAPKFAGEFRVEYRSPGQYHFGTYLYDHSNYEWQKWGTYDKWWTQRDQLAKDLGLGEAGVRYQYLYGRRKNSPADSAAYYSVLDKELRWAHGTWVKNHTPSDDNPLGVYDYRQSPYRRYLIGFGGPLGKDPSLMRFYFSGEYRNNPTRLPTPERNQIYQNYLLSVTIQPMPSHKFKLMGMLQKYRGGIYSGADDIRWSGLAFTPPGTSTKYYVLVDPVRAELTFTQSLNWVYTINPNSFLDATISHQHETYELPYEYLVGTGLERDRLDSLNDTRGSVLKDGLWSENTYFRQPFNFSTNYYQDNRTDYAIASIDYTNQITPENLMKAGARAYYWDMANNGVNSSFQANTYLTRSGYAEYYHAYPWLASLYVQDKMEYSGMVANVGLRAESFNFRVGVPADLFNPFYQGTSGPGQLGNPATVPSETQFILLPRLGLSFPVGENTAFRLQYGHFASMPIFTQALSQRTQSGWIGRGNPNLEPKKTINYEFGLQQVVNENHRLDVALYYNDRVRQIGLQRIASYTGSRDRPAGYTADNTPLYAYTTFANNAFGSTLGMEVTFEKIIISRWTYRLSYTLSQTTDGNYGAQYLYPDNTRNYAQRNFTGEFISSYDRTHNFRGLIQYSLREGEGIDIVGFKPFASTVFSLIYTAQSGTPFTYRTTFDLKDVVNNRRYPLESSFDFNAQKTLRLLGCSITVGLRVMNVFNNKWVTPMSVDEDVRLWVEQGVTVEDPGNNPTRFSYLIAPYTAYRNIPRQVFITAGFGF